MTIFEHFYREFHQCLNNKNREFIQVQKYIIAETQRRKNLLEPISDTDFISILKKYIEKEKEFFELTKTEIPEKNKSEISFLETYLPKQVSEEELKKWIIENTNATELSSNQRKKIIGIVLRKFGSATNGKTVGAVLETL